MISVGVGMATGGIHPTHFRSIMAIPPKSHPIEYWEVCCKTAPNSPIAFPVSSLFVYHTIPPDPEASMRSSKQKVSHVVGNGNPSVLLPGSDFRVEKFGRREGSILTVALPR